MQPLWVVGTLIAVVFLYVVDSSTRVAVLACGVAVWTTRDKQRVEKRIEYIERLQLKKKERSGSFGEREIFYESKDLGWWNLFFGTGWDYYKSSIANWAINLLQPLLDAARPEYVESISVRSLSFGTHPPHFKCIRLIETNKPDTIKFEAHMKYIGDGEAEINVKLGKRYLGIACPILLSEFLLDGIVMVQIALVDRWPWTGTVDFEFTEMPDVDVSIKPLKSLDLMEVPWLSKWLREAVTQGIIAVMVRPNLVHLPFDEWWNEAESKEDMDGVVDDEDEDEDDDDDMTDAIVSMHISNDGERLDPAHRPKSKSVSFGSSMNVTSMLNIPEDEDFKANSSAFRSIKKRFAKLLRTRNGRQSRRVPPGQYPLQVDILESENLSDSNDFVYCVCRIGNRVRKSKRHRGEGNVSWNDNFVLPVKSPTSDILTLEVFERRAGFTADKMLGFKALPISLLSSGAQWRKWVNLQSNSSSSKGRLLLGLELGHVSVEVDFSLERWLQHRPDKSELVEKGIVSDLAFKSPAIASMSKDLEKRISMDELQRKISKRPSITELQERGVLVDNPDGSNERTNSDGGSRTGPPSPATTKVVSSPSTPATSDRNWGIDRYGTPYNGLHLPPGAECGDSNDDKRQIRMVNTSAVGLKALDHNTSSVSHAATDISSDTREKEGGGADGFSLPVSPNLSPAKLSKDDRTHTAAAAESPNVDDEHSHLHADTEAASSHSSDGYVARRSLPLQLDRVKHEYSGGSSTSLESLDQLVQQDEGARLNRRPNWIPDLTQSACSDCGAAFSVVLRRHHCRSCGGLFCKRCSSQKKSLDQLGYSKPQRVCDSCFETRNIMGVSPRC